MQTCRKQRGYLIAVGQIKDTTADEKGRDALENDGQNVQYKRGRPVHLNGSQTRCPIIVISG